MDGNENEVLINYLNITFLKINYYFVGRLKIVVATVAFGMGINK
jgi:hypothetical protein